MVFWYCRILESLDMEIGAFSLSSKFGNCEDGFLLDLFRGIRSHLGFIKKGFLGEVRSYHRPLEGSMVH